MTSSSFSQLWLIQTPIVTLVNVLEFLCFAVMSSGWIIGVCKYYIDPSAVSFCWLSFIHSYSFIISCQNATKHELGDAINGKWERQYADDWRLWWSLSRRYHRRCCAFPANGRQVINHQAPVYKAWGRQFSRLVLSLTSEYRDPIGHPVYCVTTRRNTA